MSFLLSLLTVCLLSSADVSASVPADNQSSYQTAFLYFLPDYEPKEEILSSKDDKCSSLGYSYTSSNCPEPSILKDKCPFGNFYKSCSCAGTTDCLGSLWNSNPYPSENGAFMSSCKNCAGNTLYSWTCSGCSDYTLSSCPENGFCTLCCNGKYKLDSCDAGYSVSDNSCEKNCVPLASETGCQHGEESCSDGCGGTRNCCRACVGSASCSGQTSACSSSQVQTDSCTDCDGIIRYTCRAKTCAEQGKKDCNGSCISTSECCGGCSSGQTCQNGTCVTPTPTCSDSGYYGGQSCSNWSSSDCMEDYGRMATSSTCNPILTNGTCSYCAYESNPSSCYGRCLGSCDVDSWRNCCQQCNGKLI